MAEKARQDAQNKKEAAAERARKAAEEKKQRNKEQINKFMEDPIAKYYYYQTKAQFPNWTDDQIISFVKYCLAMGLVPFKQSFDINQFPGVYVGLNGNEIKILNFYKGKYPVTFINAYRMGKRGENLLDYIYQFHKNDSDYGVCGQEVAFSNEETKYYIKEMTTFLENSFGAAFDEYAKNTNNATIKKVSEVLGKSKITKVGLVNIIKEVYYFGQLAAGYKNPEEFLKATIRTIADGLGSYFGGQIGAIVGMGYAISLGVEGVALGALWSPLGSVLVGSIFAIGGAIAGMYVGSAVGEFVSGWVINFFWGE